MAAMHAISTSNMERPEVPGTPTLAAAMPTACPAVATHCFAMSSVAVATAAAVGWGACLPLSIIGLPKPTYLDDGAPAEDAPPYDTLLGAP